MATARRITRFIFTPQFSQPITNFGVWSADIPAGWTRKREDIESQRYREVVAAAKILHGCREMEGDHLGFFSEFSTTNNETVLLKSGISFVSIAGRARKFRARHSRLEF